MKRITKDQVIFALESEGLKLVGDYIRVDYPLCYICKCNRQNKTTWHDFNRGTRCGFCGPRRNQKYNQEEIKNYLLKYNCTLLGEYKSINQKISYICGCGNKSQTTFKAFKRGNKKCHKCSQVRAETSHNWIKNREEAKWRKNFRSKCHYLINNSLKRLDLEKTNNTHIMLGYSVMQLKEHIEKFPEWNEIKKRKWHLDHIYPIKAFMDYKINDFKIINSLINLQPLTPKQNLKKGDKYDLNEFKEWLKFNFSVHV